MLPDQGIASQSRLVTRRDSGIFPGRFRSQSRAARPVSVRVLNGNVIVVQNSLELNILKKRLSLIDKHVPRDDDESKSEAFLQLRARAEAEGKAAAVLNCIDPKTVEWRLKHESVEDVFDSLVKVFEIRKRWASRATLLSFNRVQKRILSRVAVVQGMDKKRRPIIWIFMRAESFSRDFETEDKQVEHASTFFFCIDNALRKRPIGSHEVVMHVDAKGAKPLNFGKAMQQTFTGEAGAFFGCFKEMVIFSAPLVVGHEQRVRNSFRKEFHPYEITFVEKREDVTQFVSCPESDIPPEFSLSKSDESSEDDAAGDEDDCSEDSADSSANEFNDDDDDCHDDESKDSMPDDGPLSENLERFCRVRSLWTVADALYCRDDPFGLDSDSDGDHTAENDVRTI